MTGPADIPFFPPPPDEHPLRGRVLDALLDAGLAPDVDEDGDVALAVQEQQLFVRCIDSNPPLMRVFGQWLVGGEVPGGELEWLRAANAVTGSVNLVKATLVDNRLVVAVDIVVADGLDLVLILTASFDAVLGSVQTWHQTVLHLTGGSTD